MSGEFEALRFAARKRGGGLAEAEITKTNLVEDAKFVTILGRFTKKARASRTVISRTSWTFLPW